MHGGSNSRRFGRRSGGGWAAVLAPVGGLVCSLVCSLVWLPVRVVGAAWFGRSVLSVYRFN